MKMKEITDDIHFSGNLQIDKFIVNFSFFNRIYERIDDNNFSFSDFQLY